MSSPARRVAPRHIPHYTVQDYRQWDGRWELIDGVAIAMTPSPFGPHERVISRFSRIIGLQFEQRRCACEVYTNLDWIVGDDTVVRPDLMVVCGQQPPRHLDRPPALAAEVLSPATRERDLTVKRALYRENGVALYLVIDPDARRVEVAAGDSSRTFSENDRIDLGLGPRGECVVEVECGRLFDAR